MEPLARLGARLGAALQGGGTEADRLLLLSTAAELLMLLAAVIAAAGLLYLILRRESDQRLLLSVAAGALLAGALGQGAALWDAVDPNRWLTGWALLGAAIGALAAATLFWMQLPDIARAPSLRQLRRANTSLGRETADLGRKAQRLAEQAQLLQEALDRSPLGTAILSPDGRWLQINPAFALSLGSSPAELAKRKPRDLLGGELVDAEQPLVKESEPEPGGTQRPLHWSVTPLRNAAGKIRARLVQCQGPGDDPLAERLEQTEALLAAEKRRALEAVALMQQGLAEREKGEAELARRAQQLERGAAQLERLGARVRELTGTDPATGLVSSQSLAERLDLAVAAARRHGTSFALLVVAADPIDDLEPRDPILLAALGGVLRTELRDTDTAARCDQERICVLLPHAAAAGAGRVAERVRRRLAATPLAIDDGRSLRLTCCVGTAEWKPGLGLGEVLGQAGEALRAARASGRNAVASG